MGQWLDPTSQSNGTYWVEQPAGSPANNVYDNDLETWSGINQTPGAPSSWTDWLTINCNTMECDCNKVRYNVEMGLYNWDAMDLDVYLDGQWVDVFEGDPGYGWKEKTFTAGQVTAARIRWHSSGLPSCYCKVFEFDFWEINAAPTAPTALECEGETNPELVIDLTPEFTAILNDPNTGDILTHVKIEVNTQEDMLGDWMWQSDWINITDCTEGNRCEEVSYAGTALSLSGLKYYWRIKAKDDEGAEGEWSAVASFRMKGGKGRIFAVL